MNKLIDEEKTPRNVFSCICHKYVAPKYRQLLLDFMDFDTIAERLVEKSDDKLTLSVSFGSYTIENENISFKEAYEQADQAMYRDKQASRIKRG